MQGSSNSAGGSAPSGRGRSGAPPVAAARRRVLALAWSVAFAVAGFHAPPCRAGCTDRDGDGFFHEAGCAEQRDCNDADSGVHPGAAEACDGRDNDCSGALDDDPACPRTCDVPNEDDDARIDGTLDAPLVVSAAWTGSGYGLAWSARQLPDEALQFSRLDALGNELGTALTLITHGGSVRGPSLAWTGSGYGLAWWDDRSGSADVYFARIDPAGNPVGDPLRVTDGAWSARWPSLVWSGGDYGLAWFDDRTGSDEIFFARIDAAGNRLGDDLQLTDGGGSTYPLLAWSGSHFGVAWSTAVAGGPRKRFALVDGDGQLAGAVTDVASGLVGSLIWTGTGYAVAGPDSAASLRAFYLSFLDAGGAPAGPDRLLADSGDAGSLSSLAWTGAEFGLVWADRRGAVYFSRYYDFGFPNGDELRVSRGGTPVRRPQALWDGNGYGVIWIGGLDGAATIYFDRIACVCEDRDGDGYDNCMECDDGDPLVHPGAAEITCDGADNDCNPLTSDGADGDGDGYDCINDCDDLNIAVHPGAPEISCDGVDNDCSQATSDIFDSDGDGYPCDVECDDRHAAVFPGAPQVCDGVNNDCSDPAWPVPPLEDRDQDRDGTTPCAGDCADLDAQIRPGAPERPCDDVDNDCSEATPDVFDADGDAYLCDVDCDETDAAVHPNAAEITCDGHDNDCNPGTEDALDADLDGADCLADCDDQDPAIRPGITEICDGIDNDCDGLAEPRPIPHTKLFNFHRGTGPAALQRVGDRFGLTWSQPLEDYFGWFDLAGNQIGALRPMPDGFGPPALAWTGADWGLVWIDSSGGPLGNPRFVRLGADGVPQGQEIDVSPGSVAARTPALAWTGTGFGMAWRAVTNGRVSVRFTLLDRDGQLTGSERVIADVVAQDADRDVTALVWTGTEFGLAWSTDGLWFMRLSAVGAPLGPAHAVAAAPGFPGYATLVWTGSAYALSWVDRRNGNGEIYLVTADATGDFGTALRMTDDPADSDRPSLTWNGVELGLAWEDQRSGREEIHFLRLDPEGGVVAGPTQVTADPSTHDSNRVHVFWTGDDYAFVAGHKGNLWLSRVGCGCDDEDQDGADSCDDCDDADPGVRPGAQESCNGLDDDCDGVVDDGPSGADADGDGVGDVCDNCPLDTNPGQADTDHDAEGDRCDSDDGRLFLVFEAQGSLAWHQEAGIDSWNAYRGDLGLLRTTGVYTQSTAGNAAAARECGLSDRALNDSFVPDPGSTAFYLVSGASAGVEGDLGPDAQGLPRPNTAPCPELGSFPILRLGSFSISDFPGE